MSYRQLATRPVLNWALVAIGARLPVAMTPLALVFLVRERPGGYALGAGLAAAYVIGEVVGASVLGPRLDPERACVHLAAGLALGACSFAGIGLLPQSVRARHLRRSRGSRTRRARRPARTADLSGPGRARRPGAERGSVLTYVVWTVASALTVTLALGVASSGPLVLAGALMATAAAGMWTPALLQPATFAGARELPGAMLAQSLGAETPVKRSSSHARAAGAHTGTLVMWLRVLYCV